MTTVVYTAVYGDYLKLNPPPPLGVSCIAFTDAPQQCYGWDVRLLPRPEETPRLQAKWPKMHAHELFPEHDTAIWIDAGCRIERADFANALTQLLGEASMAFMPHRWRQSIYPEALATLALPKYARLPVVAQAIAYREMGFPDLSGLAECTCFVQHPHDPESIRFMDAWWQEQVTRTYADQISWPFVAWQTGIYPAMLPFDMAHQDLFSIAEWRGDR